MNIMANANPDMDRFSHCKVCNERTTKTTILKHMNRKKTLVRNVLRTCKEHDIEEFNLIKDSILALRKAQKREYQREQDQKNIERKRHSQRQYDQEHTMGVIGEICPLNIFVAVVGLEPTLLWKSILQLKKDNCCSN